MHESRVSPLAVALATLGGNLVLVVATLFFGFLSLLFGWIPPRGRFVFGCARAWSRCLLWGAGLRLERELLSELPPGGRFVVMSNHQGLYDIPALLASLPFEARFLAKRSLFRIPVMGWAMSLGGFVPVDRGDRKRAREAFGTAVATLSDGVSILLFPEETRSPDGRLLPFRRGGFLLALKSGLPILPVGVDGTYRARPKGAWTVRPGVIRVRYGRPVDGADLGLKGRRELEREVRRQILELSGVEDSTVDTAPEAGRE